MLNSFDPQLVDVNTVKILICYLLNRLGRDISENELYEICVMGEIMDYFLYTDAIDELLKNETIFLRERDGEKYYEISEKGKIGSEDFKLMVPGFFRDRALSYAMKYLARKQAERDVKFEITESESGCKVRCRYLGIGEDMLDFTLFTPDDIQAELVKDKILRNPTEFYAKLIKFITENEEEDFDT